LRFTGSKGVLSAGCTVLVAAALSCAQTSPATGDTSQTAQKPSAKKSPATTDSAASAKGSSPHSSTSHSATKSSKQTSASTRKTGRKSRKNANWRRKGQQKIDRQRALEIQSALIREHYMDGKPSGVWDDATQQAMQKYQADNGWQSKTTPDARALIKLGLGPDQGHLLNPESAMTSAPAAANGASSAPNADGGATGKNQPQK
jgi:hypothetical protein